MTSMIASEPLPAIEKHLVDWFNDRLRLSIPISAEIDLLDGGYLDSLLIMDVLQAIERDHHVEIESAAITPQHFRTVRALAALINRSKSAPRLAAY